MVSSRRLRVGIYWALIMAIALFFGAHQGYADDFNTGLRAYLIRDYQGALQSWQLAANKGDALAQHALGYLYDFGIGIANDSVKATDYYSRAGAAGIGESYFNLGLIYLEGRDVLQDLTITRAYWLRASNLGVRKAIYGIGVLYYEGMGVESDSAEAANWLRRAAEKGYREAEYLLGEMLIRGLGLPSDKPAGVAYLARAAARGHQRARQRLTKVEAAGQAFLIPKVERQPKQDKRRRELPPLPPLPESSPIARSEEIMNPFPLPQDDGVQAEKQGSTIRLWIGSYADQDKARERWGFLKKQNPDIFQGLRPVYLPRLLGGLRMFHLIIEPITDRSQANRICNKIEAQQLASYCRLIIE